VKITGGQKTWLWQVISILLMSEVFSNLVELGQNPVDFSDTVTILENVGHRLDEENERLFRKFKDDGFSKKKFLL
jgi:amidophosphoribosyltransferase